MERPVPQPLRADGPAAGPGPGGGGPAPAGVTGDEVVALVKGDGWNGNGAEDAEDELVGEKGGS